MLHVAIRKSALSSIIIIAVILIKMRSLVKISKNDPKPFVLELNIWGHNKGNQ